MFSFTQQGWLFAALAMGTLGGSLATDYLCSRIGFRHLTTIFGLASGVGTLGTPMASWLPTPVNFYAVFVARLLQVVEDESNTESHASSGIGACTVLCGRRYHNFPI